MEWISVKERLPKDGERVLLSFDNGPHIMYFFINDGWMYLDGGVV